MTLDTHTSPSPLYARFALRFRGILVDWMIVTAIMFGAIFVAVTVANDSFSRVFGCTVILGLLLYEPVLVSVTGGTLGHHLNNLRVVDERTGGNVSFLKACARVVIKGLLSWYSFVILAATRRNQAIHDLLTRSTVRIRNAANARPDQYITERVELSDTGLPSRARRATIIVAYLLLLLVAFEAISVLLVMGGMVSHGCIDGNYCSGGERIANFGAGVALIVLMAAVIAFGWKGKLFGARRT